MTADMNRDALADRTGGVNARLEGADFTTSCTQTAKAKFAIRWSQGFFDRA
jgi:hypothetical protein